MSNPDKIRIDDLTTVPPRNSTPAAPTAGKGARAANAGAGRAPLGAGPAMAGPGGPVGPGGPKRPQDKQGHGRTVVIVVLCLLVAIAVVVGIVLTVGGNSGFFDSTAQSGQAPYKSDEEIQAELNRQVEEGMLNISIASMIEFEDGASEGTAYIENVPNNHYVVKVDIVDNNTQEKLYESGGIRPGEFIEKIALTKDLEPGTYDATATFTAYEPDTLMEVGQAAAIVTLDVKN